MPNSAARLAALVAFAVPTPAVAAVLVPLLSASPLGHWLFCVTAGGLLPLIGAKGCRGLRRGRRR